MKKLAGGAILVTALLGSQPAYSGASDAISYLSNGPTSMEAANRKVFSGGSMRMYVPQTNTQFVSITPPSFSAGCNGIDAAFGGFSFINGEKFKQMVKSIMQAAPGYALDLAIRTLCPMCADVLQKIRDVANWANNLSLDSCGAAMSMVNSAAEAITAEVANTDDPAGYLRKRQNKGGKYFEDMCKAGNQDDRAWYENAACQTGDFFETHGKTLTKYLNGVNNGKSFQQLTATEKTEVDGSVSMVNKTFAGAIALGIEDMDSINLLISVLGTSFANKNNGGDEVYNGWGAQLMDADIASDGKSETDLALEALIYVLMVGLNGKIDASVYNSGEAALIAELANQFNQEQGAISNLPYRECTDATGTANADKVGDYFRCSTGKISEYTLSDQEARDNRFLSEKGYVTEIAEILISASRNVANGDGLTDQQMALVNLAPLPVYRMLKVSAIYPNAGKQLIASYSKLIALMIMRSHFVGAIQPDAIGDTEWDKVAPYRTIVNEAISRLGKLIETKKDAILSVEMAHHQNLMGVLATVDRVIGEKAVTSGSAGASLFSKSQAPSGSYWGNTQ